MRFENLCYDVGKLVGDFPNSKKIITHGGVIMGAIETALQYFSAGKISQAQLDIVLNGGSEPVNAGASTAVAEPVTEPEVKPSIFESCSKCDKDWTLPNHAPKCGFKDATSPLDKANAKIAHFEALASTGGVNTPAQGLELVEVFEVPFQKETDGNNLYGWTTEEAKVSGRKFGKYYSNKLLYAKGRKLKVTYEVIL